MSKKQHRVIDIREAEWDGIEENASIAIIGKRRTGKTTWAKFLLQYISTDIDRFCVMCGNKDNINEWSEVVHPLYLMYKNLNQLQNIIEYQDARISKYGKEDIPKKYKLCIVFDDCGCDRKFMHSDVMKDLLSNGRHYGITVIILCQYLNQMHCENRDQLDYVMMLYTSNIKNIKKIHDEYVNICDIRTFKYILNACTLNKGACWIDNTKNTINVNETVFYKKMTIPINFNCVGSQTFKEYGNLHILNNTDDIDDNISDNDVADILDIASEVMRDNNTTYTDNKGMITIQKQIDKIKRD